MTPEQRERKRAYLKEYRSVHKEELRAKSAASRERHREELRVAARQYRIKNAEVLAAKAKKYREANRDKCVALSKAWRMRNSEYVKEANRRYFQSHKQQCYAVHNQWAHAHPENIAQYGRDKRSRLVPSYARERLKKAGFASAPAEYVIMKQEQLALHRTIRILKKEIQNAEQNNQQHR